MMTCVNCNAGGGGIGHGRRALAAALPHAVHLRCIPVDQVVYICEPYLSEMEHF